MTDNPYPWVTTGSRVEEHCNVVSLPANEMDELASILESFGVQNDMQIVGMDSILWT